MKGRVQSKHLITMPLRHGLWSAYFGWPNLLALTVLLVNDHVLKAWIAFPRVLTGKLSDFAGLFFFPIFAFTLVAWLWAQRTARPLSPHLLTCICGLTGLAFAALQLSTSFHWAYTELLGLGFSLIGHAASSTQDPSDLIALPSLLLAHQYGKKFINLS